MIFALVVVALALLHLPRIAHRLGRRLSPSTWALIVRRSVTAGSAALVLSLLGLALPTLARAMGAKQLADLCDELLGHLPHGATYVGWISAFLLMTSIVLGCVSYVRSRRQLNRLFVESSVGTHLPWHGIDVAVLPVSEPIAYSRQSPFPQIVLSEGLAASLDGSELELLLRHESVHLQRRDERILVSLAAIEAALRWLPTFRDSVPVARLALERWADETAAGPIPERRQTLASALAKAASAVVPAPLAAFSSASLVAERIEAMEGRILPLSPQQRVFLVVSSAVLRFTGSVGATVGFLLLTAVCTK